MMKQEHQTTWINMKKCTKCGEEKELDLFPKDGISKKTGLSLFKPHCRECAKIMCKKWFEKNEGYKKEWRKLNHEKVKQENVRAKKRTDIWREKNKDILKIKKSIYRKKNIEHIKEKNTNEAKNNIKKLLDRYVISKLIRGTTIKRDEIKKYPELIESKRQIILIKRLCRTSQN